MKTILIFLGMLSAGILHAADTTPSYPLSVCVVSGDKLGVMGAPVIVNQKGTEVHFCCKDCVTDFQKDPDKYLKRLQDAQQKKEN